MNSTFSRHKFFFIGFFSIAATSCAATVIDSPPIQPGEPPPRPPAQTALATPAPNTSANPSVVVQPSSDGRNPVLSIKKEFTLRELVRDTLTFNPELKFYEAEISAAKGQRRKAGEWPNPTLGVEIGQKRATDASNILVGEGLAWSVSISQTFDFTGRPALRKAIANRQVELAEVGLEQFKKELEARVLELGCGLLIAQREYDAAEEISARAQAIQSVLVQRDPAGIAPLLENRAIEARVVVFERAAALARQRLLTALQEINLLRGASPNLPLILVDGGFNFNDAPNDTKLISIALQKNYLLQQRRLELEQQGFQISLAQKDSWGEIKVSPFYSQARAGDREQVFGIAIELPLPVWQVNQGEIDIATARRDQAQAALSVAQRDLYRDVVTAALAYRTSMENLRRWGADATTKFREAADLGDRNYRLGTIPLSTYLELQSGYLDALEALLETESEALQNALHLAVVSGMNFETLLAPTTPQQVQP